jgi:hypothetical protein
MKEGDLPSPLSDEMVGPKGEKPTAFQHDENTTQRKDIFDLDGRSPNKLNAVFENPLANVPRDKLLQNVEDFCQKYGLMDHIDAFRKGALISQNPAGALDLPELQEDEKAILRRESTHKWSQPWQLYFMACKFPKKIEYCTQSGADLPQPCARWPLQSKAWTKRSTMAPKPST